MTHRRFFLLVFCLSTLGWHQVAISQFAPAVLVQREAQAAENPLITLFEEITLRERAFLSRVCELSADQKTQADSISADLKGQAVKKGNAAPAINNVIRPGVPQIMVRIGNNHVQLEKASVSKFRESLHEKYKTLLTDQQQQAYEDELKARDEFVRRANAECLVAILDLKLALEKDQIEPLRQSLMEWGEAEDLQLAFYLQENAQGYMPPIPLKFYAKLLNPTQRKVFDAAHKMSVNRQQLVGIEW